MEGLLFLPLKDSNVSRVSILPLWPLASLKEEQRRFSKNEDVLLVLIVNYILIIIFFNFYKKKVLKLKLLITH